MALCLIHIFGFVLRNGCDRHQAGGRKEWPNIPNIEQVGLADTPMRNHGRTFWFPMRQLGNQTNTMPQ